MCPAAGNEVLAVLDGLPLLVLSLDGALQGGTQPVTHMHKPVLSHGTYTSPGLLCSQLVSGRPSNQAFERLLVPRDHRLRG